MNRACPYCAEEVSANAKICPHCRQWLSVHSLRNPTVFLAMVCSLGLVCIVSCLLFFRQIMNPGKDFSPYRESIYVVESRMNFQSDEKEPSVNVVVVLTNRSEFAWKDVQMDLRFYNAAGTMIDAMPYWNRGEIYPNGELAFRIKNHPSHALGEYDSYKIFVRSARDVRAHF